MINQAMLMDINDVHIQTNQPVERKIKSYLDQIANPYHFRCGDVEVTVEFSGEKTLEDTLLNYLAK